MHNLVRKTQIILYALFSYWIFTKSSILCLFLGQYKETYCILFQGCMVLLCCVIVPLLPVSSSRRAWTSLVSC